PRSWSSVSPLPRRPTTSAGAQAGAGPAAPRPGPGAAKTAAPTASATTTAAATASTRLTAQSACGARPAGASSLAPADRHHGGRARRRRGERVGGQAAQQQELVAIQPAARLVGRPEHAGQRQRGAPLDDQVGALEGQAGVVEDAV